MRTATMGSSLQDRDKLEAAYIGFGTLFANISEVITPNFARLATVVDSNSFKERYNWLGQTPTMQRWDGDRPIAKLRGEAHEIENFDWANGIEVDRNDIRDDKLGLWAPKIAELVIQGFARMDALVIDHYKNGFDATEGVAYDGQFIWDSDHTAAGNGVGTSQTNVSSDAFSATALDAAVRKMMEFVDENDEPVVFNGSDLTLLAGPEIRHTVRDVLAQPIKASGESNMNLNEAVPVIHPRITGPEWFVINSAAATRPVILQQYQMPMFAALDSLTDLHAFLRKTFLYGADMSVGVGYGDWKAGVGSDG